MEFDFFQVDAFSSRPFRGNPAAVVPLTTWLPDDQLLNIAAENNLSETAFFMAHDDPSAIELRWFTPAAEVALCGHATLATAHVLFAEKKLPVDELRFETRSVGPLIVRRSDAAYTMDFPAQPAIQDSDLDAVVAAVGQTPQALFKGYKWMAVMADESAVRAVKPDMAKLARLDCEGLIVTSPGEDVDFVSRFFAPKVGVPEDPVTGSAHCVLTPYWDDRLARRGQAMTARQISARGGDLTCRLDGSRVVLTGEAVTVIRGRLILR